MGTLGIIEKLVRTRPGLLLFAVGLLVLVSAVGSDEGKENKNVWEKTKAITKRAVKKVKEVGRAVGEEVQEVFDPEDEDLQAKKKTKKKQ